MKRKIAVISILALAGSSAVLTSPGWRILGPGGGGAQFKPTVSPHDPNTVLLATDMTGGFITHDAGGSWRRFSLRTWISSYAFDPRDPKVMYAGETGVYRSEDGGGMWRLVFPDPAQVESERNLGDEAGHFYLSRDNWPAGKNGDWRIYWVPEIRIDPERPDSIFVAVCGRPHIGGPDFRLRIYHSADRAKTWKEIFDLPGQDVRKIYIDPSSPREMRRIFVATDTGLYTASAPGFRPEKVTLPAGASEITDFAGGTTPSPILYLVSRAGVFRSVDLGKSWTPIQTGLLENLAGGTTPEFTLLAPAEKSSSTVYLAVKSHRENDGQNYFGVVKTEDGGGTWRWVMKASKQTTPRNKKVTWVARDYDPEWGEYPIGIGADPTGRICYVSDLGTTYRTLDGGKTWEEVYANDRADGTASSRGIDLTSSYGVHFDPFDPQHIAVSYTDIGLFHSFNGGESWAHSLQGVPEDWINTCYWVAFDPDLKGRAWSVWAARHDLPRTKMLRGYDANGYPGGVCRSDDGLKSWRGSSGGLPPNTVATHIILDPKSPKNNRTLYIAAFRSGVYKSTDGGQHWELKNRGIADNFNTWHLALTPDGTLYVMVTRDKRQGHDVDGALYRSRNGAEEWERMPLPAGTNWPNDLVFDPADARRMYLSCWPRTENSIERGGGIFLTEDGGQSWKRTFDEAAHIYGLAVDPRHPATLFAVSYDNAAYRSDDRGLSWRRLPGFNFKLGNRPFPDPNQPGMLYITTYGSSIWHGPANGVPGAREDLYPPSK